MAERYSWQESKSESSYRSAGQDHLGWWAAAAMLVSVLLHVIVFFALDGVKLALGIQGPAEVYTERVHVVRPLEQSAPDLINTPPPEETAPPAKNAASLLEEIDILKALPKDQDIDVKPQTLDPEYAVQMKENPAAAGEPEAIPLEVSAGLDIAADLPAFGRTTEDLIPMPSGRTIIDPGSVKANDSDLAKFTEDLIRNGAGGRAEKGTLDGVTSLDDLIGLQANELMGKKTMLPSDLLFEFNKYELRESAKFGLQKLGLLIDNNPSMYCWIEGHTDLIGGDAANLELSRKRAEAVKEYLVKSMRMEGNKIITRGFGRFEPIITSGDRDQQAPNRRVEIKMRKTPPADAQIKISPPKAATVAEEMPPARAPESSPPPRAMLVKPNPERAIPVEVLPKPAPRVPKATAVIESLSESAPRALPIAPDEPEQPAPAKAIPVPSEPAPAAAVPRAQAIDE